ncbi:hypothetical protein Syun_015639 [Stephania yunnanensis]|uniref:AAA+ ATPase domain-containing protein n=1 Tax=Stephania yunnanensis TaxID=152371 RepID=A0AAP0JM32_9MAGN
MPSTNTLFSAYASVAASVMLVRSIANEFIPQQLHSYVASRLGNLFSPFSSQLTLIIEEFDGLVKNEVYESSETYLSTRITPSVERLRVIKAPREKTISVSIEKGQELKDVFEDIVLTWRFVCAEAQKSNNPDDPYSPPMRTQQRFFELSFCKKHKDRVITEYLPYVIDKAKAVKGENKVPKLYTLGNFYGDMSNGVWGSINLEHPATFDTLAMDPEIKKDIIDDIERFLKRREFYRRVGKAWKRGYLLYGPPGTGKSSLIAAMANYLKFDVYDLELSSMQNDAELRRLLVATANRSILVIEDIDCSADLKREREEEPTNFGYQTQRMTLSGLLNFIDGLWTSCGDERIIVFTTNHKEKLDPALLRPGRMDKHIHMSYCTNKGFKLLALNYLGIDCEKQCQQHKHFGEIEELIEKAQVTPAEVAEELMKSDDAEECLGGVVKFLKRKHMEGDVDGKDETETVTEMEIIEPETKKPRKMARRTQGKLIRRRGRGGAKIFC